MKLVQLNVWGGRNLQHVQVALPSGKAWRVFNHHGHYNPLHKKGNAETMRQCQIIADKVKACTGPIVLAGDFNLTPRSVSVDVTAFRASDEVVSDHQALIMEFQT